MSQPFVFPSFLLPNIFVIFKKKIAVKKKNFLDTWTFNVERDNRFGGATQLAKVKHFQSYATPPSLHLITNGDSSLLILSLLANSRKSSPNWKCQFSHNFHNVTQKLWLFTSWNLVVFIEKQVPSKATWILIHHVYSVSLQPHLLQGLPLDQHHEA